MPNLVTYTPPWLSKPSPGSSIFSDPAPQSPVSPSKRSSYFGASNGKAAEYQGPRRLVATRGTEVFTVVGNKIRWADLSTVKNAWEGSVRDGGRGEGSVYKTLSVPVYYQIRQLSISPSGVFLAICTEHTIHVTVLPDPSRLREQTNSPVKLKTYQLGPTTHVIPESPVVSTLWHPMSVSSNSSDCVVTVTAEAAVRVWELDKANQWSFERPALAIDLKKLADGTSSDGDFEPSAFGKNRTFSVDEFEMEVSAACFGGIGNNEEDPWASMTLWTAMRNGDVYALCPLIPTKWRPSATTIPSLSTGVVSRWSVIGNETNAEEQQAARQQYEWMQEIDATGPTVDTNLDGSEDIYIRYRPASPGAIPRLQGPFELRLDDDDAVDLAVSDIHVIASTLDEYDIWSGEDGYDEQFSSTSRGIPFTLICLATTDGKVHVSMDAEGVSGQWLPRKARNVFTVPDADSRELILVETFRAVEAESLPTPSGWPTFTPDPRSTHVFYLTTSMGVFSVSVAEWCSRLGMEISAREGDDAGFEARVSSICQSEVCQTEEIINVLGSTAAEVDAHLSTATIFDDVDIGYVVLATSPSQVYAVSFDQSYTRPTGEESAHTELQHLIAAIPRPEDPSEGPVAPRPIYAVPAIFTQSSTAPLMKLMASNQFNLKQPIKLSPATLEVVTSAHRVLSSQTSHLEKAAAELFRRCERLREELKEQVRQMAELADRLQHINDGDDRSGDANSTLEARLSKARDRQKGMLHRYERLRNKAGRVGPASRELSQKERIWVSEVQSLSDHYGVEGEDDTTEMQIRYAMAKQLATELLNESKKFQKDLSSQQADRLSGQEDGIFRRSNSLMSSKMQKEKINDVMAMVEREGAVIEAVMVRLGRLSIES